MFWNLLCLMHFHCMMYCTSRISAANILGGFHGLTEFTNFAKKMAAEGIILLLAMSGLLLCKHWSYEVLH